MRKMMTRVTALSACALMGWGCGLVGPSCLSRQKTGDVAAISAEVGPGQTAVHQVAYGTDGSQNDVRVSWTGQGAPGGPQLLVFATKADCSDFKPPPAANRSECSVLGSAGAAGGPFVSTLTITHGRGNPEILGSPAAFKLWVVGDPSQQVRYSFAITWFFGPDC